MRKINVWLEVNTLMEWRSGLSLRPCSGHSTHRLSPVSTSQTQTEPLCIILNSRLDFSPVLLLHEYCLLSDYRTRYLRQADALWLFSSQP